MAITTAMRLQVTELYVALFGRAPDAEGLGFWTQALNNGTSLTAIADSMYNTTPARAYYPLFLTNTEIVTAFYVNVLGRAPDTEGLNFWVAKLNAPGATPGSVINSMVDVVVNYHGTDPAGLTSAALFANKVTVAEYFAEHVGTVAGSTAILSTITSDPATVTAAENAINTPVPQNFNLTTGVDNIDASGPNTVTGTADVAGTLTTGDIIKGNSSTKMTFDVNGTPASYATIANVGTVNINADADATVNADLWSGIGTVEIINPSINGKTLTLSNAQVATTYGIVGANANLTVTFRDTTGAADTASAFLAGAGTTTFPVTLDLSSGNSVEGLVLNTTGTNIATVNPGTADKTITLGGDGTNTLTFGATAGTLTFNAGGSTGTNKFTFAAGSIGVEDTLTGGTGTDTVTANTTQKFAHMTGIENFVTTVDSGVGLYDGANVSGLKTMTINQGASSASEIFSNMKAEFTTLTVNGPTGSQEVDYVTGAAATLAVTYGPGSTAFDTSFDGLSVDNVKDLTVTFNTGGTAANAMTVAGDIVLDKTDTTSLTVVNAGSLDTFTTTIDVKRVDSLDNLVIRATGEGSSVAISADVATNQVTQGLQNLEVTASGANSYAELENWDYNGYTTLAAAASNDANLLSLTTLSVTASGASSSAFVDDYVLSIGPMASATVTASGDNSQAWVTDNISVSGDVGSISFIASGQSSSAYIDDAIYVYGGLSNLSFTASGVNSNAWIYYGVSATGDMGTISITASGDGSGAYVYDDPIWVGGNLGSITVTASGSDSNAGISSYLEVVGDTGAVALIASGGSADAHISYMTFSGSVDSLSFTASGDHSYAYAYETYIYGDLGTLSLTASGTSSYAWVDFRTVSGDLGAMTITASGHNAEAYLYDSNGFVGGNLSNLTVLASGSSSVADFNGYDVVVAGNVGTVAVTASGKDAYASAYLFVSGNMSSLTVTASGATSDATAYVYNNDGSMTLGTLTETASGVGSFAYTDLNTGSGVLASATISATKLTADASFNFVGNTFGSIATSTGTASSSVELKLDNTTSAGGTITGTGPGTLTVTIVEKAITSLSAGTETGAVTVTVSDATKATTAMTITTGAGNDIVEGGKAADTFSIGSGDDKVIFSNVDTAFTSASGVSSVTDTVTGFTSGAGVVSVLNGGAATNHSDVLDFSTAGSATNYKESLTANATLAAFVTAANTSASGINATVHYYFGTVTNSGGGVDGYLAYDSNGDAKIDGIIKLTGLTDFDWNDII